MTKYKIKLRNSGKFKIKPGCERLNGLIADFIEGWIIEETHSSLYAGEKAMLIVDRTKLPINRLWIASGDLELLGDK